MIGQLFTFLFGLSARLITSKWLIAGVAKMFAFTLFTTVLPTILIKIIQKFIIYSGALAADFSSDSSSIALDLIGLGGYLANQVSLPAAFSMIISALALRATLNIISARL